MPKTITKFNGCPVCGATHNTISIRKDMKMEIRNVLRHITGKARMELWNKEFYGLNETPHVAYLHDNAILKKRIITGIILKS